MTERPAPEPVNWEKTLREPDVQALIQLSITEDVGNGDVTTEAIFEAAVPVRAAIVTRRETVACGIPLAEAIFRHFDPQARFDQRAEEGSQVAAGETLLEIRGDIRGILVAERCALNYLMRLCGIACGSRRAAEQVPDDCHAKIYDTRKTTPGWRRLEKIAVHTGGAANHRFGLFDAVLIKDNHIAAAGGSVGEAVRRARAHVGHQMVVEVEIDTLDQLAEALETGPDIILLDNFTDEQLRAAVQQTLGRAQLEASGGVTLERIPQIARTGVDRISLGALTHTVAPADLGLDMLE